MQASDLKPSDLRTREFYETAKLQTLEQATAELNTWPVEQPSPRKMALLLNRFLELLDRSKIELTIPMGWFARATLSRQVEQATTVYQKVLPLAAQPSQMLNACELKLTHVAEELVLAGVPIASFDAEGLTALHYAVDTGDADLVKFLARNKFPIGIGDAKKDSALHRAAASCNVRMVSLLVSLGAPVNALNDANNSPLRLLCLLNRSPANAPRVARLALGLVISGANPAAGKTCASDPRQILKEQTMCEAWTCTDAPDRQDAAPFEKFFRAAGRDVRGLIWSRLSFGAQLHLRRVCKLMCNTYYHDVLVPVIHTFMQIPKTPQPAAAGSLDAVRSMIARRVARHKAATAP